MPHAIAIDQARARRFADTEHATVNVRRHTAQHVGRWRSQALGPVFAHQIMVAADPSGRDDHGLRAPLEITDDSA
jgi:hypothetical protein